MAGQGESCAVGAIGCVAVTVTGGFLAALLGGHFHINFGGVVFLLVIGGGLGLLLNGVYERGKKDGEVQSTRSDSGDDGSAPTKSSDRRATPTFVVPWGHEQPATITDAVVKLTEKYWARDNPEVRFGSDGASVRFRATAVMADRMLEIVASESTDTVSVRLSDELGEVFAETGSWREATDSNADLVELFQFVEALFMGRIVHVLSGSGEHRLIASNDLESMLREDPATQARSWDGSADRDSAEK